VQKIADIRKMYQAVRNMKAKVSKIIEMKVRIILEILSIMKKYAKQRQKHSVLVPMIA